jgi:hypothetical protein
MEASPTSFESFLLLFIDLHPLNQEGLLHQTLLQFVGFDAYTLAPEL